MAHVTLLDTYIAGLQHHVNVSVAQALLIKGSRLNLVRDPTNKYDGNAVEVRTKDGTLMGFIPRESAQTISGLLLAGYAVHAYVTGSSSLIKYDIRIGIESNTQGKG